MSARLRIAMTVDPYVPVPPVTYGGIERVVAALIPELIARNHDVTLFAHPGSRTAATHVPYGAPPHHTVRARATELWQVGAGLWSRRGQFDVVHSFGRLAALVPILADRSMVKIQSYQREVPWGGVARAVRLAGASLSLTACSDAMWQGRANERHGNWTTVYNGVDLSLYTSTRAVAPDAPLMFLGRLERIKGVHTAIAIAKRADRRLIIAGNQVDSTDGRAYFEQEIRPHLNGTTVTFVGPVDDEAKNRLLGSAAALLMPIEWEEPFGIVMAEAMACGTPVIGFGRGSVPEVVEPGLTGVVVNDVGEAVQSISFVLRLDRSRVRARCAQRFSYDVIADGYEQLYRDAVGRVRREWRHAG
jgi:glycosyltransferase involved in cell wall biosynthesis